MIIKFSSATVLSCLKQGSALQPLLKIARSLVSESCVELQIAAVQLLQILHAVQIEIHSLKWSSVIGDCA